MSYYRNSQQMSDVEYNRMCDGVDQIIESVCGFMRIPRREADDILRHLRNTLDYERLVLGHTDSRGRVNEQDLAANLEVIIEDLIASSRPRGRGIVPQFPQQQQTRGFGSVTIPTRSDPMEDKLNPFAKPTPQRSAEPANTAATPPPPPKIKAWEVKDADADLLQSLTVADIPNSGVVGSDLFTLANSVRFDSRIGVVTFANIITPHATPSPEDMFNLVRHAIPHVVSAPKWCIALTYFQVEYARVDNYAGVQVKNIIDDLSRKLRDCKSFPDLLSSVVPILNNPTTPKIVSKRLMTLVNRYLKTFFRSTENPTKYPKISEWSDLYEFTNRGSTILREFMIIDGIEKRIWNVMRSAFEIGLGSDRLRTIVTTDDENMSLIASLPLPVLSGKHPLRDYFIVPSETQKDLKLQLDRDWLIMKSPTVLMITNIEKEHILTDAHSTVVLPKGWSSHVHAMVNDMFEFQYQVTEQGGFAYPPVTLLCGCDDNYRTKWSTMISHSVDGAFVYSKI